MSKQDKILIGIVAGFLLFVALAIGGQYVGGLAFAAFQKIPSDAVTLTTLWDYWHAYSHIKLVKAALVGGIAVSVLAPVVPFAVVAFVLLSGEKRELHGSARFATAMEVRKAGLLGKGDSKWPPIILAKYRGEFLQYWGKEFLSLASATQGGKGVGCVIPNLLSYPHSVVNLDIKLENWKITAGFRAMFGQQCYLFAPGKDDFTSHRWNPLFYIRRDDEFLIGDIQNQAEMWFPIPEKEKFWMENSQILFMGLCLYMIETPGEECTMPNLVRLTTPSSGEGLDKWLDATIRAREEPTNPLPRLSVECVDSFRAFLANAEKSRGDILGTFLGPLKIFRDPILAAATSGNDFDLREVRRQKMSIYIGMTTEDLVRYGTLMNIFFSQLINLNTKVQPEDDPSLKYQCLLLLDEFTALGRINIIRKAIAFMASYNMRLVLIYQNNSQVAGEEDGYGREGANTLLSNCTTKMLYQPDSVADSEEYSKILGNQTAKARSTSRQPGRAGQGSNENDAPRPLMLPQELREKLGFDKVIVTKKYCKPIYADKIIYWKDPAFEGRVGLPPPFVPRLEIVRAEHRTRPLLPEEASTITVDEIANHLAILKAMGDAIGFDFSTYHPEDLDVALAA